MSLNQPESAASSDSFGVEQSPALPPAIALPVRWVAPVFNTSGYASEAISFLEPLAAHLDLGIRHNSTLHSPAFIQSLPEKTRACLLGLQARYAALSGGIVVQHCPGYVFQRWPDADYHIGRTMFETDRVPANWVEACNRMDEIWVPSRFNLETFAASGVERAKIKVIPGAVDEHLFNPDTTTPLPLPHRAGCNFLSVFEWSSRKGWDVLLAAYLREFSAQDDVCLHLRTHLFGQPGQNAALSLKRAIEDFAHTLKLGRKPLPRVELLTGELPLADLPRLYRAVDCLVAPSRGEGWGRPQHEAMMMGLPVIATRWSGNTEFMTPDTAYLLDYELTDTANLEPSQAHYRGHHWAEPFEEHLRQLLRQVFSKPHEARALGQRARKHVCRHYSQSVVAELILARLRAIEAKIGRRAHRPAAPEAKAISVAWEGTFLDYGSLSLVNRSLTASLQQQPGLDLRCVQRGGQPGVEIPEPLTGAASTLSLTPAADTQITVRHAWPPVWQRPARGKWVLIQPWEFGALPAQWVRELENVDEAWVPTQYVRDVYIDSGVPAEKVKVIPNGIDPQLFHPAAAPLPLPTRKRYKFLFVGGTIGRKGPDILLKTFLATFTAKDDVCLVIKDFGGKSFYAGQTLAQAIQQAQANPKAPEIVYLDSELPPEQIASLYTACDCLVHPYRGEGFGLPVLEAMACGLPVIVTGGGATDDFATDAVAYRLPATRKPTPPFVGNILLAKPGWLLEPDPIALAERMRWVVQHRDQARAIGRRASEHARTHWTWAKAAEKAIARLQHLSVVTDPIASAIEHIAPLESAPIAEGIPITTELFVEATNVFMSESESIPAPTTPRRQAEIERHIEQAEVFMSGHNPAGAIAELECALALNPRDAQVISTLGLLNYQQEQFECARQLFRRLIELRPADSRAYTQLALASHQLGRTEEFEAALGLALELDPDNLEALRLLGRLNLQSKRYLDAARTFRHITEQDPKDIGSMLALASCLYHGGERPTARMVYERVLEADPNNKIARNNLNVLTGLHDASEPIIPPLGDPSVPPEVDAALAEAQAAINQNRFADAAHVLEAAVTSLPQEPVLAEALANLFVALKQYTLARRHAEMLTAMVPGHILAWVRLGLIGYKLNDLELFERGVKKALAIDPQNVDALRLLGHANFNVGNYVGATRQYRQILQQLPDDVEILQALGNCLHHQNERDAAAKLFQRVLELDPQNQIANANLKASQGEGMDQLKAHAASNGHAAPPPPAPIAAVQPTQSVHLELPPPLPRHVTITSAGQSKQIPLHLVASLGGLDEAVKQAQIGQPQQAALACLEAIALRPFHPDAYFYLAQIALTAGDEQQALACLNRLQMLTPDWAPVQSLHQLLLAKPTLSRSPIAWPELPALPAQPRLTICMIVKNEEAFLAQALASVKALAHQIIVVDTGSTDRTVEIASAAGAEVHRFEWNDNFADARNFSLLFARGDWVLILDADEELMAGTHEDLRRDLGQTHSAGLRIPLINAGTTASGASYVPRLFRNAPGLCFLGRVHEQVFSTVMRQAQRWQLSIGLGKATLLHHGYAAEVKQSKDKVKRNLNLLERALEELPGEPALLMNYGLDLFNDGQIEKALVQLRQAAEAMQGLPLHAVLPEVRERLVNTYTSILMQAEQYEEAADFAQSKLAQASGPTATAHYLRGLALLKLQRATEAVSDLEACIQKASVPTMAPGCAGVHSAAPHHLLAECHARDGRAQQAETHFIRAIELEPVNAVLRYDFAKFLDHEKRPADALNVLHDFLLQHPVDARLWAQGASIANGSLGDDTLALSWTQHALLHHPEHIELRKHRAIALLTAGQFAEALALFESTEELASDITTAAIYLCRIASGQCEKLTAPSNEATVSQCWTGWYRRLMVHENDRALRVINSHLPDVDRVLPTAGKVLREAALV
ncbi:MAG: tetratricopeptide repeat protein [Pedosphaera sp.]|nr:tetratricopeptide repeat protein [Pedosphaera sp.]MSU43437.1 tetratricopeptide repeat protein [Pedosphaera sp.]